MNASPKDLTLCADSISKMERGMSFSSISSASTSSSTLSSNEFKSGDALSSQSTGTPTPPSEIDSLILEEEDPSSTNKTQSVTATILPDLAINTKNVAPIAYDGTLIKANTPTGALANTSASFSISQTQRLPAKSRPAEAFQGSAALTRTQTAFSSASSYSQAAQPHPLSPLEHEYDPSKDDVSIDELLARPRLPRTPYERFVKTKTPMTPEEAEAREAAHAKRRAEDLERRKRELRSLALDVGGLRK